MTYYINNNNSYIKLPSRFHKLRMFFLSKEEKAKLKLITEDYELFEKTIKETIPPPAIKNYYFVFMVGSCYSLPPDFQEIVTPKYGGTVHILPMRDLNSFRPQFREGYIDPFVDFSPWLRKIPCHKRHQFLEMCTVKSPTNNNLLYFNVSAWVEKVPYYKLYIHVADYLLQKVSFSFSTMDNFSKKVFQKMAMKDFPNKYGRDSIAVCETARQIYNCLLNAYVRDDMHEFKFGYARQNLFERIRLGNDIEHFFSKSEEEMV